MQGNCVDGVAWLIIFFGGTYALIVTPLKSADRPVVWPEVELLLLPLHSPLQFLQILDRLPHTAPQGTPPLAACTGPWFLDARNSVLASPKRECVSTPYTSFRGFSRKIQL